jgi:L-threonylcarbamoyladenylate synthase
MTPATTQTLPATNVAAAEAARLILAGQVVAVPTETVYGLAADATNPEAVTKIYEAKGRPSFNPLIIHVPDLQSAEQIADLSGKLRALAEEYWPGPLTLVAPLRQDSGIASLATAGLSTVAVRVPRHPAMQALLRAVGRPLAAPSANASGSISPTRAEHVLSSLGGRIPLILDGGLCTGGIESTIVAEAAGELRLLRPGLIVVPGARAISSNSIEAPGQLASHYAPRKSLRLNATSAVAGEYLIGFASVEGEANLSPSGNLVQAAAHLFELLHQADSSNSQGIAVAPIPQEGLGAAINDRLKRAAAPR